MEPTFTIMKRERRLINIDPLRRCYNGAYFSSELVWTAWEPLVLSVTKSKAKQALQFWRELNDYAVSQRGAEARSEYQLRAKAALCEHDRSENGKDWYKYPSDHPEGAFLSVSKKDFELCPFCEGGCHVA